MTCHLREWSMDDAESTARYANNPKIAANLRDGFPHPYALSDAEDFIRSMIEAGDSTQCCRAIIVNGETVGSIGLFLGKPDDVHRKTAELGYWLAEPWWGKGIISQAISSLCDYAFKHYDLLRIYAEPYSHNVGSQRALEKCGFTLEGILRKNVIKGGQVYDSCMYAKIRG